MASTVVESRPPLNSTTALGCFALFSLFSIRFTILKDFEKDNRDVSYAVNCTGSFLVIVISLGLTSAW